MVTFAFELIHTRRRISPHATLDKSIWTGTGVSAHATSAMVVDWMPSTGPALQRMSGSSTIATLFDLVPPARKLARRRRSRPQVTALSKGL